MVAAAALAGSGSLGYYPVRISRTEIMRGLKNHFDQMGYQAGGKVIIGYQSYVGFCKKQFPTNARKWRERRYYGTLLQFHCSGNLWHVSHQPPNCKQFCMLFGKLGKIGARKFQLSFVFSCTPHVLATRGHNNSKRRSIHFLASCVAY